MTEQLEMFEPKAMAPGKTSVGFAEAIEPSENPPEELEGVAKRVRRRLKNMNAHHIEIGRDLQAVKDRLSHGQFFSWVTSACGLSRRTARLLMRSADRALNAPSTVQIGKVPSGLMQGQKLDPRVVKVLVRAAKAHKPAARAAARNSATFQLTETPNVAE
jgi:Protein of unknown function (DUF3102)